MIFRMSDAPGHSPVLYRFLETNESINEYGLITDTECGWAAGGRIVGVILEWRSWEWRFGFVGHG